jgi:membrane-bound lytic murein transglycosylase A
MIIHSVETCHGMSLLEYFTLPIMESVSSMYKLFILIFFSIFFSILIFAGCAPEYKPDESIFQKSALKKLSTWQYPDFTDDLGYNGIKKSILNSISYLEKIKPDTKFIFGKDIYTATELIQSLIKFSDFIENRPTSYELNKFIRKNYNVYMALGENKTGRMLYTGYYEPLLYGILNKNKIYKYPIYTLPNDLIYINLYNFSEKYNNEKRLVGRVSNKEAVPYFTREEIDYENILQGRADVIAWTDDIISLFFLHIQGSGEVFLLDEKKKIKVNYHGANGRKYKSIGKLLIDKGKISVEDMSMQKIRSYLKENPQEIREIFTYNPSYVFFKIEKGGPFGCINVPLTPQRSIATDKELFPQAGLAFVKTEKPILDEYGKIKKWKELRVFVKNQDTGGAIKGLRRADFFWGSGKYAEIAAGHMKQQGELYFLAIKKKAIITD